MANPQTTREDRVPHMRQTWKEITESDTDECEMMADYRWACDEIEHLRAIVREVYGPACAELGPACEDIAKDWPDVLERALQDG